MIDTVFLDRDGVLNRKLPEGSFVRSWAEFEPLPGIAEAVARLNRTGARVLVVSNQRGIALGLYSATDVDAIHAALDELLRREGAHIDGYFHCPHERNACDCRKPLPGLFYRAQACFAGIEAERSAMIGDALCDVEFGKRLGMLTIYVGAAARAQKNGADEARALADAVCGSLPEAVDWLMAHAQVGT